MIQNERPLSGREKAAEDFRARFLADEEEHKKKIALLSATIPGFAEITKKLEATGLRAMHAAIEGRPIEDVRRETEELRKKRRELLASAGYAPDFADRKYRCEKCSDSGFVGLEMCTCLRKELTMAALDDSGLGKLVRTQSFETFSLDYYSGRDLKYMKANAARLYSFAKDFNSETKDNFLLIGGTGLGKTHLCSAVTRLVVENGYDVVYRPAGEFFSVFTRQRFGDGYEGDGSERSFFKCDLLILDDLGTEVTTQYTVSWLYDVLNYRLNEGKPTIISTNLTEDALRLRYDDRITSRIFGYFTALYFVGKDVRAQKTSEQ